MDFTALDWVLLAVAAFFAVVGLFRGLSGQLGSLVGIVAALVVGYFAFAPLRGFVQAGGMVNGETAQKSLAAVADFVVALIAFGLSRRIVARFVSFLVPQPTDAIAGAVVGLFKGAVAIGALTGVGIVQTGRFSEGFFASHSSLVRAVGEIADSYMQGATQ